MGDPSIIIAKHIQYQQQVLGSVTSCFVSVNPFGSLVVSCFLRFHEAAYYSKLSFKLQETFPGD